MNGGGWEVLGWWIFASSFVATMIVGWTIAELVHRSGRKLQEDMTADEWTAERRGTWTQVGALRFRDEATGIVFTFADTPAGRLAAKRFQVEENVTGPKVLHTRDKGRR